MPILNNKFDIYLKKDRKYRIYLCRFLLFSYKQPNISNFYDNSDEKEATPFADFVIKTTKLRYFL